jgi:hypothetical protein
MGISLEEMAKLFQDDDYLLTMRRRQEVEAITFHFAVRILTTLYQIQRQIGLTSLADDIRFHSGATEGEVD